MKTNKLFLLLLCFFTYNCKSSTQDERANKLIEECQKNKSKTLNLSNCSLVNIPAKIQDFVWLEELSLRSNQITKIEGLDKLVNLSTLSFESNQITKIEGLDKLTKLNTLILNENKITRIEGLDKLINLSELHINSNKS
jgi:Leucine-rich repeat (LRR) protein